MRMSTTLVFTVAISSALFGNVGTARATETVTGAEMQALTQEILSFATRNYGEINFAKSEFVTTFEQDFGVDNLSGHKKAVYLALWTEGLAAVHNVRSMTDDEEEYTLYNAMKCERAGFQSQCVIKVNNECKYTGNSPHYCIQ